MTHLSPGEEENGTRNALPICSLISLVGSRDADVQDSSSSSSSAFSLSLSVSFRERGKDRHFFEGRHDVLVGSTRRIEQRNVNILFSQKKKNLLLLLPFPFFFFSPSLPPSHHAHNRVYNSSMCIFPKIFLSLVPLFFSLRSSLMELTGRREWK